MFTGIYGQTFMIISSSQRKIASTAVKKRQRELSVCPRVPVITLLAGVYSREFHMTQ